MFLLILKMLWVFPSKFWSFQVTASALMILETSNRIRYSSVIVPLFFSYLLVLGDVFEYGTCLQFCTHASIYSFVQAI